MIQKRGCCEPILRCDGRQSHEIRNDRRERRIVRIASHIDPPPGRNLLGRRIRERKRCEFRCRLLGMVLGSSDRFDVARNRNESKLDGTNRSYSLDGRDSATID